MNSPELLVERLDELVELAAEPDNGFEKAAVYAATKAIQLEFVQSRKSLSITL